MQVIAGKARRLLLKTLPGMETRPTSNRIKETLFNILQPYVQGCRFLDLFAGCGGIGIEALSRGAREAYFVEKNRKAVRIIEENLVHTKLRESATVWETDALAAIRRLNRPGNVFDIIFLDPPYDAGMEKPVLEMLENCAAVSGDTLIIVEAKIDNDLAAVLPASFEITREKKYKNNKHVFIRKKEAVREEE
ncbi:MAG: 16S rRNA (guanine(966)-N(2))-methyltransferase RsmD [Lachnospiraceae bacterium]|nr:16S rRNA (guanine(966)-N(2))-methyltransferase RsmD [Lachnospiraceae bacterium]